MCKIAPILNGKDNLCWVSKELNKTKHDNPTNEHVIKYMVRRRHQTWLTIKAIQSSVADTDPLYAKVQQFAGYLLDSLKTKYTPLGIANTS